MQRETFDKCAHHIKFACGISSAVDTADLQNTKQFK